MSLRDLVLAEMRAQGGVVSAYALADVLSAKRQRRVAANSVYRVLNHLIERDCVRRVEHRNGFIVVPDRGGTTIAICNRCDRILWLDCAAANAKLRHVADSLGFKVSRLVIELNGACATCSRPAELPGA